eukprot:g1322.t1
MKGLVLGVLVVACLTVSVNAVVGPNWTHDPNVEAPKGEKDMGGWTAAVYTEEQMERLGVDMFGQPVDEPDTEEVDENAVGCCFDHGFGAMMVPCCFSNHRDSKIGECETESRHGGRTAWDQRTCSDVKVSQGFQMGCCYDHGMSRGASEVCCFDNHRDSFESDCPVASRIGGKTVWDERPCEAVKSEQDEAHPKKMHPLFPGILPVLFGDTKEGEDDDGHSKFEMTDIGIIYPPPDVRAIVDKTAQFVAKSKDGKAREDKLMSSVATNLKFGFLRLDDPYRAYYDFKVKKIREEIERKKNGEEKKEEIESKTKPKMEEKTTNGTPAQTGEGEPKKVEDVAEKGDKPDVEVVERKAVQHTWTKFVNMDEINLKEPPRKEQFTVDTPHDLRMMDEELIKLTAQFTAAGGKEFLRKLVSREHSNPQFAFLKETHLLFKYFMGLVGQYSLCINPPKHVMCQLEDENQTKKSILKRCVHRLEFQREVDAKRKAEEAAKTSDRVAFQSIDWHDFVVVETIEFVENEALEPSSKIATTQAEKEDEEDMDMSMDMDMGDDDEGETKSATVRGVIDDDEEIEVREDYTPNVPAGTTVESAKYFVDEDGQKISIEESEEIMRIKSLDPRWHEQQQRAKEKTKTTALAKGEDLARNLAKMAARRQDIFGTSSGAKPESDASEASTSKRVIWDGNTASAETTQHMALKAAIETTRTMPVATSSIGPRASVPPPPRSRPAHFARPPSTTSAVRPRLPLPPPRGRFARPSLLPPPPPRGMMPMMTGRGMRPPPMMVRPPMGMMRPPRGPNMGMMVPPRGMVGIGRGPLPPRPSMPRGAPSSSMAPATAASTEPPAKKARVVGTGLEDEKDWAASHPDAFEIAIQLPRDDSKPSWNLNGQRVTVSVGPHDTLRDLKNKLSSKLGGMPRSKQQLKLASLGFLKDKLTMAYYNLDSSAVLEFSTKTRGRRR